MVTIIVASGLSLLPVVHDSEEDLGLSWLFHARGLRSAPDSVIVISIDKSSSRHFNLPNLARKWPRDLHARLIDRLNKAGARVVAFDVHFKDAKDRQQDLKLAEAIGASANVVLFSFLQKQVVEARDIQGRESRLVVDELVPPISVIADAAVALAPNPLPKVPVKVSQFWKFVPEAGDAPTLPVLAYQLYLLEYLPSFIDMLSTLTDMQLMQYEPERIGSNNRLPVLMTALHELFVQQPDLRQRMRERIAVVDVTADVRRNLNNLLALYAGPPSQYISYYGPARSVRTIPFYQVLESDQYLEGLRDKLVFIGFSEHRQWEQQDGFYSVFSNEEGLDISGVEITAAAAANLLEGVSVRPMTLGMHFLVILLVSIMLAIIYLRSRGVWLPLALFGVAGLYFLLAWQLFAYNGLWLPLVVPLLIQLPVVLLLGMTWNYQELNRERKNIQRAFGYYLPETEVNRLARDITSHDLGGQLMHGTCLSTDAQQYTTLSEKMTPQQLTTFMNEYYESIFTPVRQHAGIISDVVGDSVMALWASPAENLQQREQAVKAAIAIVDSVAVFNQQHPGNELPTRIGLHYGVMVIGNVGAVDHYEYRAVGDIVNTTSRIEGMSKYLGVRLLASADVLEGLEDFDSRFVGRFILKGKTVGLPLFEIGAQHIATRAERTQLWQQFAAALALFQQGLWTEAGAAFEQILQTYPHDGPSSFYRHYCEQNRFQPPENWQGVIHMQDK